jgi:hypothetical protein
MRRIFVAADPIEAEAVSAYLNANEIRAIVRNEHIWPIAGVSMTLDGAPAVWILDDADEQRALHLLQERSEQRTNLPPWSCDRCHEENEGAFGVCWKCNASAPPLSDPPPTTLH